MRSNKLFFAIFASLALLFVLAGLSSAQTVHVVHTFSGANGQNPLVSVLTQGRDGRLYGTTYLGGSNGLGTIFKQRTVNNGNVVLYNFGGPDGSHSADGLMLATDGNYYGTTQTGGTYGFGTVFKITSSGVLTTLYSFTNGSDGAYPSAPPIQATDGNYYGTANSTDGTRSTLYMVTPAGIFSTISNLSFTNGVTFVAALVQGTGGYLYATAESGGASGCGAILKLTTSGLLLASHSFACGVGGLTPVGTVVEGLDGNLYGTAQNGGTYNAGIVFKIDGNTGAFSTLYSFGATPTDGLYGYAGLTLATDGNFYGATALGGSNNSGSLYSISSTGTYSQLYSFPSIPGGFGQYPIAALRQDTNGKFYGVTTYGGASSDGSVYTLDMGLSPFVTFVKARGQVGAKAQILGQGLTGTTSVTFNGVSATSFNVTSDTYMTAVVPAGATTGPVVVTTPSGPLTSNVNFRISK